MLARLLFAALGGAGILMLGASVPAMPLVPGWPPGTTGLNGPSLAMEMEHSYGIEPEPFGSSPSPMSAIGERDLDPGLDASASQWTITLSTLHRDFWAEIHPPRQSRPAQRR